MGGTCCCKSGIVKMYQQSRPQKERGAPSLGLSAYWPVRAAVSQIAETRRRALDAAFALPPDASDRAGS